jgi:N utilization substance protein A
VTDPETEIALKDARLVEPDAVPGLNLEIELPFEGFGRSAVMAAKQVITQRVREARRERVYEEFLQRVGEIVIGTVEQVDRGTIIVNVEGVEAVLPLREQIRRERYKQGDAIRAYLCAVERTARGPEILLSRSHPEMVKGLFEMEVPEMNEGVVKIEAIAREGGLRTKIAVTSRDDRVDAVGACVGMKGSRVQAVVRELGGERLDIIPYNPDPAVYIRKALSPAKVSSVHVDEEQRKLLVVVPEDQLSLAIGKSGQNVRLAAKLTGWNVDLVTEEQYDAARQEDEVPEQDVSLLKGIGERLTQRLVAAGFETVKEVAEATPDRLAQVPGIGPSRAAVLHEQAREIVSSGSRSQTSP